MQTLVLDLATQLGFCFGDETGVIEHGSHKLPSTGNDIGAFLDAYRLWLGAYVTLMHPVDEIVFEMPILGQGMALPVLRKLYSLCGLTELIALRHKIPSREANLLDIRRHFIGSHRAPKDVQCKPGCKAKSCGRCRHLRRMWLKETTISMCRARGFRPADDNAADALALFSYVQFTRNKTWELLGTEIARAA